MEIIYWKTFANEFCIYLRILGNNICLLKKNKKIKLETEYITTKPSLCKDNQILNTIFEITIHPEGPWFDFRSNINKPNLKQIKSVEIM